MIPRNLPSYPSRGYKCSRKVFDPQLEHEWGRGFLNSLRPTKLHIYKGIRTRIVINLIVLSLLIVSRGTMYIHCSDGWPIEENTKIQLHRSMKFRVGLHSHQAFAYPKMPINANVGCALLPVACATCACIIFHHTMDLKISPEDPRVKVLLLYSTLNSTDSTLVSKNAL